MIRVAILAPALALRVGLREVFRGLEDIEVVSDASTLDELSEADVLVLTSPDYLSDLDEDAPAVLLLTDDQSAAAQLMDLPVWGVLSLDASAEELSAAVRALGEGLWTGSPALLQDLLERQPAFMIEEGDPIVDPLTPREREVLQLAAEGLGKQTDRPVAGDQRAYGQIPSLIVVHQTGSHQPHGSDPRGSKAGVGDTIMKNKLVVIISKI